MISIIKKYPLALLMFVSALMLLPHLGLIQTNIMEARNLVTAREMVHNGHWVFTTLNGLPRYEKPPLPTWITAMFGLVFGFTNMFWLRLPVVLITLMLVYFFYKLMKEFKLENSQPLNASLILITSFYIFFGGRDNQWDIYTHAFMVASIYYLIKSFNHSTHLTKNLVLSGLFFGCSFLSKGPISLYALWLPFIIAYFFVYRINIKRNVALLFIVLFIGLITGLSWYIYIRLFDAANVHAAVSQESGRWRGYELKPIWYYWSFFTQSGVWTVPAFAALMYWYMKPRVTNLKAYQLAFWWTILSVVLLSLVPEKKSRYLLPVLIPMAMNTGFYLKYLIKNFKNIKSKLEITVVNFAFGLITIVALVIPFVLFFIMKQKLHSYLLWFITFAALSILSGAVMLNGLIKKQFNKTFYTIILYMCVIVVTVIPLSKIYYSNKNYYAASNLHSIEKKFNIKTYEVNGFEPEIIWDYGDVIPQLNKKDSLVTFPQDSVFGLMTNVGDIQSLKDEFKDYQFDKQATVDLNEVSKEKHGYNQRLAKEYYLVKKS